MVTEMIDKTIDTIGVAIVLLLGVALAHREKPKMVQWGIAIMSFAAALLLGDKLTEIAGYPKVWLIPIQLGVGMVTWPTFDLAQSILADRQKMLAFIWAKLGVEK